MIRSRLLLTLSCLAALSACDTVKTAARIKKPDAPASLRLTLLPQTRPEPKKSVLVDAKITRLKDRSRVIAEELKAPGLRLLAIDSNYSDFQLITPEKSELPGLFHFRFIPASQQAYRLWADVEMTEGKKDIHEFPFADIGGKSGRSFPRKEVLGHEGYRLALSAPLTQYDETVLKLSRGDTDLPIAEAFGFYDDYRTVLHLSPTNGSMAFTPHREGFLKLLLRVNDGGGKLLPFVVEVKKD